MNDYPRLLRLEQLLLTLWVGSLLAIGYLAVPILFSNLDDRRLAGELAGQMFHGVYSLGLVCGLSLLVIGFIIAGKSLFCFLRQWRHAFLVIMLLLVMAGFFIIQPQMAAIKLLPDWQAQAELKAQFGRLHGMASVMYLLTSIMGVVLVLMGLRKG